MTSCTSNTTALTIRYRAYWGEEMKAYDVSVLLALEDALKAAYWYKSDLKSMLIRSGVPDQIVTALPWKVTNGRSSRI